MKRIKNEALHVLKVEGVVIVVCFVLAAALWGFLWAVGVRMALNPLSLCARFVVAANCIWAGIILLTYVGVFFMGRHASKKFTCTGKEGRDAVRLMVLRQPHAWDMSPEQFQRALGQARLGQPIDVKPKVTRGRTTPRGTQPGRSHKKSRH